MTVIFFYFIRAFLDDKNFSVILIRWMYTLKIKSESLKYLRKYNFIVDSQKWNRLSLCWILFRYRLYIFSLIKRSEHEEIEIKVCEVDSVVFWSVQLDIYFARINRIHRKQHERCSWSPVSKMKTLAYISMWDVTSPHVA